MHVVTRIHPVYLQMKNIHANLKSVYAAEKPLCGESIPTQTSLSVKTPIAVIGFDGIKK